MKSCVTNTFFLLNLLPSRYLLSPLPLLYLRYWEPKKKSYYAYIMIGFTLEEKQILFIRRLA